ncbi:CHASE2 domain-containing protein [Azovibrio restrictus]|uniref:CHASE2 domain-containing protein n=1 Tax=Azovibrio restrictus TaxID=146938 RepID=UPI000417DB8A|nr:adenylate/guanylate cyclase domain-containing protein [Azovibrio restrictus]
MLSLAKEQAARLYRLLLALLLCALVMGLDAWHPPVLQRLDESLRDVLLQRLAYDRPEDRVTLVDIDDESLRRLGQWPWSRGRMADLVEILLTDYQARTVGLDIVFPEARDEAGDERLANLARYAPLALAQVFDYTPRTPPLAQGSLAPPYPGVPRAQARSASGYIANHAGLSQAARCVGNIGYLPDQDGVLRHLPLYSEFAGQSHPQFALALLQCAAPEPLPTLPASLAPQGLWRVPFRHPADSYTVLPAWEILQGDAPLELVQGRHVIVGSSSLNLSDRVSTPLNALISGVMVHAQSVSALLDLQEGRTHTPWNGSLLLALWLLASVTYSVFRITRLSAWHGVLLLLGLALAWLLLATWGFLHQAEWSLLAPMAGYFVLLITVIPYEWWQAQRRGRQALETLSHYVAKPVLEELQRQGKSYSLAPTLREVTVLIADMEGYTRLTSTLPLETAAHLTKVFLDCLTRPVLASGGTLDKYSGDGLVAFWGAPLDCPDQADRAVETALEILEEIRRLNQEQIRQGLPMLRARIGIESGSALVGDLGTPFRSTYTAVGDCINFASRLESAAKNLPFSLVIGASANAKLQRCTTRSAGEIHLRDTATVIQIYTVPLDETSPG